MRYVLREQDAYKNISFHTGCSVPVHLQLLSALRYFASGSLQLTLADCMELSASSVCKFVRQVAATLASISPDYIQFPEPADSRHMTVEFLAIAGMPAVIGCIDGSLIPIRSPGGNTAELYRCRKGFLGLNIMAVCDAKLRFMNIISSWPGSFHDCRIFDNSRLCQKLQEGGYSGYLLGDFGYSCKTYLLTPLRDPQTDQESKYNAAHIRTRNTIERCLGVWKRRFGILKYMRTKLQTSKKIIIATAVLHNIAVNSGVSIPNDVEQVSMHAAQPEKLSHDVSDEPNGQALRRAIIQRWF